MGKKKNKPVVVESVPAAVIEPKKTAVEKVEEKKAPASEPKKEAVAAAKPAAAVGIKKVSFPAP